MFASYANEDHHNGNTPMEKLSVGLVSQVPLDYMHLVCFEVTHRLLLAWLCGLLTCRLPSQTVDFLSCKLIEMRADIPAKFSRKPRSVREIDRWKATEYR